MLSWSVIFLGVTLLSALFGFTVMATSAAGIAGKLFFVFLVLFVLVLIGEALLVNKKKSWF